GSRWTRVYGAEAERESLAAAAVELLLNRCANR
ncbi:MAG: hypothetical protein RLZZ50_2013, partial [Verrucomicrobiota bacterium]